MEENLSTNNEQLSTNLDRKEAWLPETAINLIEQYLEGMPPSKIFEFGCGSSTLWLNEYSFDVISVEHDKEWFDKINQKLIEIDAVRDEDDGVDLIFHKMPYNTVIERYDDNYFDLILVDGRNRQACIRSAIPKLKSGGWLVLDNSEREYYKPAIDMMADWNQIICKQNRPDKYNFHYPNWQCTIFIKP